MKPKQNNKNKRQKQQQQRDQKQQASDKSKSDDVEAPETADTMTSSVECSTATAQNIPANNSDNQSSTHPPSGDTDHVTNRCADDVTSDTEVADILHAAPATNPDLAVTEVTTSDPEVTEVMTSDPEVTEVTTSDLKVAGNEEVVTELIMAKTFTESTHPDREFVPIRHDTDDVINPLPVESADSTTTLTVRCELVNQPKTASGRRVVTSSGRPEGVDAARGQVRELTSELRHLQSLLDDMSSPAVTDMVDTSSEEELDDDWRQPSAESRVVYHYHLHDRPPAARRWIRRAGDTTSSDLNTQHQEHVVGVVGEDSNQQGQSAPRHETCLEHGSPKVEELKTQHEQSVPEVVKEDTTRTEGGSGLGAGGSTQSMAISPNF